MRYALVLFDLDGVLIDSRANMEAAWTGVCAKFGFDIPFENYFAEIGLPFADILRRIGATGDSAAIAAAYSAGSVAHFDLITVYPGIVDLLAGLRRAGLRTGIVTSKDAGRTARAVDLIGARFDVLQPPAAGLRGKPAPDQLLAAAETVGIPPERAVYIGDMAVDRMAAANAGMAYGHADWGYGPAPPDADFVAGSADDLHDVLVRGGDVRK